MEDERKRAEKAEEEAFRIGDFGTETTDRGKERYKGNWKRKDWNTEGTVARTEWVRRLRKLLKRVQSAADVTLDNEGESRLGEGQVGWKGWISFLWGSDLQSGSGTGTPFNQRYSNCIGWPLRRVSLGDFTRLTRLQDFEDIIVSRNSSIGVWEDQAIRNWWSFLSAEATHTHKNKQKHTPVSHIFDGFQQPLANILLPSHGNGTDSYNYSTCVLSSTCHFSH